MQNLKDENESSTIYINLIREEFSLKYDQEVSRFKELKEMYNLEVEHKVHYKQTHEDSLRLIKTLREKSIKLLEENNKINLDVKTKNTLLEEKEKFI